MIEKTKHGYDVKRFEDGKVVGHVGGYRTLDEARAAVRVRHMTLAEAALHSLRSSVGYLVASEFQFETDQGQCMLRMLEAVETEVETLMNELAEAEIRDICAAEPSR